ncbi:hypothetical protein GCM10028812_06560 [Ancylobacter sonchi]
MRRAEVAAVLRAHQQRWDDADRAIGYSVARQQEEAASADEECLVARLLAADATSLRGLSAKLDVLIAIGADGAEGRQFPWPEVRRMRRDVACLMQTTVPKRSRKHSFKQHCRCGKPVG